MLKQAHEALICTTFIEIVCCCFSLLFWFNCGNATSGCFVRTMAVLARSLIRFPPTNCHARTTAVLRCQNRHFFLTSTVYVTQKYFMAFFYLTIESFINLSFFTFLFVCILFFVVVACYFAKFQVVCQCFSLSS